MKRYIPRQISIPQPPVTQIIEQVVPKQVLVPQPPMRSIIKQPVE